MLRRPALLVLDEATGQLHPAAERAVTAPVGGDQQVDVDRALREGAALEALPERQPLEDEGGNPLLGEAGRRPPHHVQLAHPAQDVPPPPPGEVGPHRRAARRDPVGPQRLQGKRPIYAREGVPRLWLLEPSDRTFEAFELREGRWVLTATARDAEPVCVPPFDAVTFSLGDLWP